MVVTAILCFRSHLRVFLRKGLPLALCRQESAWLLPAAIARGTADSQIPWFPGASSSALNPCVGDGVAFEAITNGAELLRYGIDLDAYRAEQARHRIPNTVHPPQPSTVCRIQYSTRDIALPGRSGLVWGITTILTRSTTSPPTAAWPDRRHSWRTNDHATFAERVSRSYAVEIRYALPQVHAGVPESLKSPRGLPAAAQFDL